MEDKEDEDKDDEEEEEKSYPIADIPDYCLTQ